MKINRPPTYLTKSPPPLLGGRARAGGQAEDGRFHAPENSAAFSLKPETEGGRKEERKGKRNIDSGRDFLEGTGLRNGRGEADWIKRREKP